MNDRLPGDDYERLYRDYRWHVPEDFNIAALCCRRWADDPQRVAIFSMIIKAIVS